MKGLRHSVGKRASEVAGHFEGQRQVLLVFQFSNIIAGAVHMWIQHCEVSPPGAAGLAVAACQRTLLLLSHTCQQLVLTVAEVNNSLCV